MSLVSLIKKVNIEGSLRKVIRDQYRESKEVLPLKDGDFLRASSFGYLCARQEVLCNLHKVVRNEETTADTLLAYLHGSALHAALQNTLLPRLGLLYGEWKCESCGYRVGGIPQGVSFQEIHLVQRPSVCGECGDTTFTYMEQLLKNLEYRISGHPDGFVRIPGIHDMGLIEIKSIGSTWSWKIKESPLEAHVVQSQIYMWLTGLRWTKVLYWDKGASGVSALTEHFIERNEKEIDRIKEMALAIWKGLQDGTLPDRICMSRSCKKAEECAVADLCFSLPSGAVGVG